MVAVGKTVENDARRVAQKLYTNAPRILYVRASRGNGTLFVPPSLLSFPSGLPIRASRAFFKIFRCQTSKNRW